MDAFEPENPILEAFERFELSTLSTKVTDIWSNVGKAKHIKLLTHSHGPLLLRRGGAEPDHFVCGVREHNENLISRSVNPLSSHEYLFDKRRQH